MFVDLTLKVIRLEEVPQERVQIGAVYSHESTEGLSGDSTIEYGAFTDQSTAAITDADENIILTCADLLGNRAIDIYIVIECKLAILNIR
ncbi:hypothetical protein CFL01nite_00260 [Corynebacterium flavescens]|uniref:Uncharacterized protein n=1 Tax=Corynebacterium flavescens TaxID=28028 RepID=A0AB73B4H0_CORFL|nr:hypothetical protein CFL01nite_00260 [Corynebacterium flavescens]